MSNMANKKKLNLASTQANKSITELPERREKLKAQVQFRHYSSESKKRGNYQNEFDRLQGAKKVPALQPNVKSRMEDLQSMARKSPKGEMHNTYRTKF